MRTHSAYGAVFSLSGDPRAFCVELGSKDSTSNNSVSLLINSLIDKGYTPRGKSKIGPPAPFGTSSDEEFDTAVKEAVLALQRDRGLPQVGRVDVATWQALGIWSARVKDCAANVTIGGSTNSVNEPTQGVQIPRGALYDRIWQDLTLTKGKFPPPGASSGTRSVGNSQGYVFQQVSDGRLYLTAAGKGDPELDVLLGVKPGGGKAGFPWWTIPVGLVAIGGAYWVWRKWR